MFLGNLVVRGLKSGIAVATWGILTCHLHAAVEVVNFDEPPARANYTDREIEIPQFNAVLGSLQSVTIDIRGTGAFVQTQERKDEGQPQLSSFPRLTLVLEAADGRHLISLTQMAGQSLPSGNRDERPLLDRRSDRTQVDPVTVAGERTLRSPADLMLFTGSGLLDLFLSAEVGQSERMGHDRNCSDGYWTVGADIKVIYNFTAVPEFSSWPAGAVAVLIVLLTGLGWRRLRGT